MSFWKTVATSIVQRAGYSVPSEKGGLNSLLTGIQQRSGNNGFSSLLSPANLTVPTPPNPPSNSSDPLAQERYNQALQTYNQRFRAYHTRMMNVMSQRFLLMQQMMLRTQYAQQQARSSSSTSLPVAGESSAIGGILDTSDS